MEHKNDDDEKNTRRNRICLWTIGNQLLVSSVIWTIRSDLLEPDAIDPLSIVFLFFSVESKFEEKSKVSTIVSKIFVSIRKLEKILQTRRAEHFLREEKNSTELFRVEINF